MNTNKKHVSLLILSILCFISVALYTFAFIALVFNLFGINDIFRKLYLDMMISPSDVDFEITLKCIEMVISSVKHMCKFCKLAG